MRVILEIDENILGKLEEMATSENRSRKNFMELVLRTATEPPPPEPLNRTFLTAGSTLTNFETGEVIKNESKEIQEVKPEIPNWKKKLLEYQTKNKK